MPRRLNSRELLTWVSLVRWKPGVTTTIGTLWSSLAATGLYRSAEITCPLGPGILRLCT